MIRYEFVQPRDEQRDGAEPMTAALWLDTCDPEVPVDFTYEGHPELIERVRVHLQDSYGTHGSMNDVKASPWDLVHAIHVSRQLDDYEPRRTVDTVEWPEGKDS